MPDSTPIQDVAPKELTAEEAQAIWNEEASARGPAGKAPPTTAADASDAANTTVATVPAPPPDKAAAAPKLPEDPVAKRFEALEQELKRTAGRVSAMQSTAAKEATKQVVVAPTQVEQAAALKKDRKSVV